MFDAMYHFHIASDGTPIPVLDDQHAWLCDSDTNARIRHATDDEVRKSLDAGHEGHILVDGRRCYVDL